MNKIIKHFIVVYAVCNEEENFLKSFFATQKSIQCYHNSVNGKIKADIIICHNGCTDKTPLIADKVKAKHSNQSMTINIIASSKGMVVAQNACINYIRKHKEWRHSPIIFVDGDSFMEEGVVSCILNQFKKFPLRAVGVQPAPMRKNGFNILKNILVHILNCRAYFPKSEIAVNYASRFHPYAKIDEQKVGAEFEKKGRIYFHGRCFGLRDQSIWDVSSDSIGEDTYLDRSIHYRFGPGSIRHMFDVRVQYRPIASLWSYIKVYYRINKDLEQLRKNNPRFDKCRKYSKTKLDWSYVNKLSLYWRCVFLNYFLIKKISVFIFKNNLIFRGKTIDMIW